MGIDYSYTMCFGWEVTRKEFNAAFQKTETFEGKFHMEPRFDPLSGHQVESVKVWDIPLRTENWFEVDGESFSDDEHAVDYLKNRLDCSVEIYGRNHCGEYTYLFSVNDTGNVYDEGRVSVYGKTIRLSDIESFTRKAAMVRNQLKFYGLVLPEPTIFVAQNVW